MQRFQKVLGQGEAPAPSKTFGQGVSMKCCSGARLSASSECPSEVGSRFNPGSTEHINWFNRSSEHPSEVGSGFEPGTIERAN